MNPENPNKDSYDKRLQFSRITPENWLSPDRTNYVPFGVTKEQWIGPFLEPQLDPFVPLPVIQLFEIARGSMIYSWFFYPLATLGLEQCTRIAETAVRERRLILSKNSKSFEKDLEALVAAGVVSASDEPRWQAMRGLRNSRSHPERLMLTDPGDAIMFLRTAAELINALFVLPAATK